MGSRKLGGGGPPTSFERLQYGDFVSFFVEDKVRDAYLSHSGWRWATKSE
jgi:hypothetical protein